MTKEKIIEKLFNIISEEMDIDVEDISLDANIREDFDADSLDMIDIIMDIEDELSVEVPDEVLNDLITVNDVVEYIERNI